MAATDAIPIGVVPSKQVVVSQKVRPNTKINIEVDDQSIENVSLDLI